RLGAGAGGREFGGQRLVGRARIRRGVEDERDLRERRVAGTFAAEGEAVHLRHEDGRDGEGRRRIAGLVQRIGAVGRLLHLIAGGRQYRTQEVPVLLVVVDDERGLHVSPRAGIPRNGANSAAHV